MKKERFLTCIVCPKGCELKVTFDEMGSISEISGNTCKRGVTYAEDECTHPRRTVTTTARCEGGGVIAVKTAGTVPKELVFDVMKRVAEISVSSDVKIGDTVIENVLDTGVDVIVTGNKSI